MLWLSFYLSISSPNISLGVNSNILSLFTACTLSPYRSKPYIDVKIDANIDIDIDVDVDVDVDIYR